MTLGRAVAAVVAVSLIHDLDHVRQGESATTEVIVTAIAGWIATIVLVVLVARRHRLAVPYAAGFGVALALGFVLVHFLPHWSAFSAPYGEQDADALSWALAALPVAVGLWLSVQAAALMRAERTGSAGSSVLRNA